MRAKNSSPDRVMNRFGNGLGGAGWFVLGWSGLLLGLYAVSAVVRFDWVGAMVGVPAIGLMVLWTREDHRRQVAREQQRIANGLPRPYDLLDAYAPRPQSSAERTRSQAATTVVAGNRREARLIYDKPGDDFDSWRARNPRRDV